MIDPFDDFTNKIFNQGSLKESGLHRSYVGVYNLENGTTGRRRSSKGKVPFKFQQKGNSHLKYHKLARGSVLNSGENESDLI